MKLRASFLLIVAAAFIAGCGSGSPDARVQVESGVATDTITDNNITRIVTNPIRDLFGEGIDIINVTKRPNDAGYLEVNIKGNNSSRHLKRFQYKIEWFDVNDFPLESSASTWKMMSANPGQDFNFFGTATRKEAVDFRLYVRKNY